MILLVNDPPPVPLIVFESLVTGDPVVFQHTPRAVTPSVQSPDTVPPEAAEVDVTDDMEAVDTEAGAEPVLNESSLPYIVPAALVA